MAPWPSFLGFLLLTCNSAIALHRSGAGGHAATILFVGVTYATLVLLLFLHCLRRFETAPPGTAARDDRARVGVWLATTLLTAMFTSTEAALMPLAVGLLVFLCLREIDQVRGGEGGGTSNTYSALAKVGLAVLTCNAALHAYDVDDPISAALVLVSYVVVVVQMGLFIRAFAQARASG